MGNKSGRRGKHQDQVTDTRMQGKQLPKRERKKGLNTQGLLNKWNTGVHRNKAGKTQEIENHNKTHEDRFQYISCIHMNMLQHDFL